MVNDCFINIQELEHSVKPKGTNTKALVLKLFAPEDIPDLNKQLGLALSTTELDSLIDYLKKNRNISDAELMMFSQQIPNIVDTKYLMHVGKSME